MATTLTISIPPFVDPVDEVSFYDITLELLTPLFSEKDLDSPLYIWDAIKATRDTDGGYTFMKTFEPDQGFMFSINPMLKAISSKMDDSFGHSGSSYGWTMRQVQYICRNGFNAYKALRTPK
jgi:hypothetical protein